MFPRGFRGQTAAQLPAPAKVDDPASAALGVADRALELLRDLLAAIERPATYGVAGTPVWAEWVAGESFEYEHDGQFAGVGVFNESGNAIVVSFFHRGARAAAGVDLPRFTLASKAYIVLPIRGAEVSVGGANAGNAIIVPLSTAQPLSAGTY